MHIDKLMQTFEGLKIDLYPVSQFFLLFDWGFLTTNLTKVKLLVIFKQEEAVLN